MKNSRWAESKSFIDKEELKRLRSAVEHELFGDIVPFWCKHAPDKHNGGFIGRLTNDLQEVPDAPKSVVLIARILWTFSALYRFRGDSCFREMAERAFEYIVTRFMDPVYGGAYWLLDARGEVINNMKKIYGQAFVIYGLSEYYAAFTDKQALHLATELFSLIEEHNFDRVHGGYFEASNRNWTIAEEMRLSERDLNERKSMNTHLHLLEAYANLYRVWREPSLRKALRGILANFLTAIIDPDTHHFRLFFADEWKPRSRNVSFGHDIEGSWLLVDAACTLGDKEIIRKVEKKAVQLVDATLAEGFSQDFGIFSERLSNGTVDCSLQWWQQAEAVVGLIHAYQLTGNSEYLLAGRRAWDFIEQTVIDRRYGEWFYEITAERKPNGDRYKICEWKGPYHNGRACLETLRRLDEIMQHQQADNEVQNDVR